VVIEVAASKLALSDEHNVEKLLVLWTAGLRIRVDLTNEVHWPLEFEVMALLFSFHH
jgi:hypothetical protein